MQTSTVSPGTIATTAPSNTTTTTKSREQILIQSSGAMIAVIVIGIIIILTILLIIVKTYNRCTLESRVLGSNGHPKPRPKMSSSTMPMNAIGVNTVSGSLCHSENGFCLPRVELSSTEGSQVDLFSSRSDSTVVTIHDTAPRGNT